MEGKEKFCVKGEWVGRRCWRKEGERFGGLEKNVFYQRIYIFIWFTLLFFYSFTCFSFVCLLVFSSSVYCIRTCKFIFPTVLFDYFSRIGIFLCRCWVIRANYPSVAELS